jgi:hypothetical protein
MIDGEGAGMTEHGVGIGVFLEHCENLRESLVRPKTSGGDGGEGTHAERRIEDQLAERQLVTFQRGFFEGAHGLGADFSIGVSHAGESSNASVAMAATSSALSASDEKNCAAMMM